MASRPGPRYACSQLANERASDCSARCAHGWPPTCVSPKRWPASSSVSPSKYVARISAAAAWEACRSTRAVSRSFRFPSRKPGRGLHVSTRQPGTDSESSSDWCDSETTATACAAYAAAQAVALPRLSQRSPLPGSAVPSEPRTRATRKIPPARTRPPSHLRRAVVDRTANAVVREGRELATAAGIKRMRGFHEPELTVGDQVVQFDAGRKLAVNLYRQRTNEPLALLDPLVLLSGPSRGRHNRAPTSKRWAQHPSVSGASESKPAWICPRDVRSCTMTPF